MVTASMRATAEVRWFYPGELPEVVEAWFERLDPPPKPFAERTDWYLRPTHPGLNIKLREGRMEIKRRDGTGEAVVMAPHAAGVLECWRKWGFPLAEAPDEAGAFAGDACWIAVRKARRLQTYRLDEAGRLIPAPADPVPGDGCQIEISRLSVEDEAYWSLCLEAFGAEDRLRTMLLRTAEHIFARGALPSLKTTQALSYAAWLMQR